MKTFLKDWKTGSDFGILLMRLVLGFSMFYGHGMGKMTRLFSGDIPNMDPIGIGPTASFALIALAEGVCAILVMVGLFTRFSAIPLIIGMAVVVFVAHGGDPFNKIELPLIYMIGFSAIFLTGGGKYSIDRFLK